MLGVGGFRFCGLVLEFRIELEFGLVRIGVRVRKFLISKYLDQFEISITRLLSTIIFIVCIVI